MDHYNLIMNRKLAAPADADAADVNAWARLMRVQRHLLAAVESDLKAAGLPPLGWYDALLELRRAGDDGLRPLELEKRLLLAQHNVSRLIDRLEVAGLAARCPCPADGRGQMVIATEAGRDLVAQMWPVYRAAIRRHVGERLTGTEANALGDLLAKLR
jgi:DNA-binding MarR family transcriptional regulator